MKEAGEAAEAVGVVVDLVVNVAAVVVVLDVTSLQMTRTHSLPPELLIARVLLKERSSLRDVALVDHDLLIVEVAVEVSAMAKAVKKEDLEGHLNAIVALGEEANSNVMVLDVVTGGQKLMKLPR